MGPFGVLNRVQPSISIVGSRPNVSTISVLVAANCSGSSTSPCHAMPSTFMRALESGLLHARPVDEAKGWHVREPEMNETDTLRAWRTKST